MSGKRINRSFAHRLCCGVVKTQKLFFFFFKWHNTLVKDDSMKSVALLSPPILLQCVDCQQCSEIEQGFTHFLLGHPFFCCPDLCWQSHMNYVMLLSAFPSSSFFFFLIRWISKIVAVQKLVVFFKKKTNSFSNILWNCFIHSFIFKPNVSRVLLLLSSNFDM